MACSTDVGTLKANDNHSSMLCEQKPVAASHSCAKQAPNICIHARACSCVRRPTQRPDGAMQATSSAGASASASATATAAAVASASASATASAAATATGDPLRNADASQRCGKHAVSAGAVLHAKASSAHMAF